MEGAFAVDYVVIKYLPPQFQSFPSPVCMHLAGPVVVVVVTPVVVEIVVVVVVAVVVEVVEVDDVVGGHLLISPLIAPLEYLLPDWEVRQ